MNRHGPWLTASIQLAMLRRRGFDGDVRRGRLTCRGVVQPLPLSQVYRVRIEYRLGDPPRTWVEDPPLRDRGDVKPIPHVYPGPRPCLYWPAASEWTPCQSIADTIVPWLLEWLAFYESWLATGEWQGGGVGHPPAKDRKRRGRRPGRR